MERERFLRAAVAAAVLLAFAGCSAVFVGAEEEAPNTAPDPMTVEIAGVEDGDTYWFRNDSGEKVSIRLVGVDTPEIRGRNYPEEYEGVPEGEAGRDHLYRWGLRIRNDTRERLVGKTVRLEFDPNLPKWDYYDRLTAYVYLNGTLVNERLLERGHARIYPVTFEKRTAFERAEQAAREGNRGLWNYTNNTEP